MIHPVNLQDDEKILYQQLIELCDATEQKHKAHFSFFLNPREQIIAKTATKEQGNLFGGYFGAERKLMGLFPDYFEYEFDEYPISAVKIIHKSDITLSHRDVLGSIIGLGITRESIGDILPEQSNCTVICTDIAATVLVHELKRVGRLGVRTEPRNLKGIKSVRQYKEISGTVSSDRLDALVALLARYPRSKATELISSGLVQQNYIIEQKPSASFNLNDTVTIRGHGKFVVDTIGSKTRKGRFPIVCRKYI